MNKNNIRMLAFIIIALTSTIQTNNDKKTPSTIIQTIHDDCFSISITSNDIQSQQALLCLQQASQGNLQPAEMLRADQNFYCYQFLKIIGDVLDSLEQRDKDIIKANGYTIRHKEYLLISQAANASVKKRSMAYQAILQHFIKETTPTSDIPSCQD